MTQGTEQIAHSLINQFEAKITNKIKFVGVLSFITSYKTSQLRLCQVRISRLEQSNFSTFKEINNPWNDK